MSYLITPTVTTVSQINGKAYKCMQSNMHRGRIVEHIVRQDIVSIVEISRRLDISRRTLYNWFDCEALGIGAITKIGNAISHDFSQEFPDELNESNVLNYEKMKNIDDAFNDPDDPIYHWMCKYIQILEKLNEILERKCINNNGRIII